MSVKNEKEPKPEKNVDIAEKLNSNQKYEDKYSKSARNKNVGDPSKDKKKPGRRGVKSKLTESPDGKVKKARIVKPRSVNVCKVCSLSLATPTHLKEHMLVHTGEKPFKCLLCFRTFSRAREAKKHVERVHKTNDNLVSRIESVGGATTDKMSDGDGKSETK